MFFPWLQNLWEMSHYYLEQEDKDSLDPDAFLLTRTAEGLPNFVHLSAHFKVNSQPGKQLPK